MRSTEEKTQYWQSLVSAQESSGLSIPQFCQEQGVVLSQFYYWRQRLRRGTGQQAVSPSSVSTLPEFLELGLPGEREAVRQALEIRLDLGAGCTLTIRRG
ncbi:hypothetical protein BAE30_10965 [Acidithiobacillus caldus]|uniref:Transposase n=1 Tax=Acidithiobacillus caldus TaxID=33059 RepID=A0A1E7YTU4_9PROT|nr:hypothetical protein BAE30_10965 [Acidithiobacillus caldus]